VNYGTVSRMDRAPTRSPACAAVEALRRQRYTGEQIAAEVGVPPATVGRILHRLGLNRLSALEPAEPIRRYERATPGEIIHIDIKKARSYQRHRPSHHWRSEGAEQPARPRPGTGPGISASGDRRPLAPCLLRVLPDEKRGSCLRFLVNTLRFFRTHGVKVYRVMTDNGSSFKSRRYAKALRLLKINVPSHTRLRPMARWSAWFKRACANGLTPALTPPLRNVLPNYLCGCTATTGTVPMAVSDRSHQLPGSAWPGTTC
jgi:hypothetical protein